MRGVAGSDTRRRILDTALTAFGRDGYAGTSLDGLAAELGIRKQTILYWFPSKLDLFEAVVDDAAVDLADAFDEAAAGGLAGLDQVQAIVDRVFRLAVHRPQVLGLVREVTRPESPTASRLGARIRPLYDRARDFLTREMEAGRIRRSDPAMLLLSLYSAVVGMVTELEVQRTVGFEPTLRSTVLRRRELMRFLRAALTPEPPPPPPPGP